MGNFGTLSLEDGFVLTQKEAIDFLDTTAQTKTMLVMSGAEDYEGMDAVLDDLYHMKKRIIDENIEWVKFSECPMGASGMYIEEMVEK